MTYKDFYQNLLLSLEQVYDQDESKAYLDRMIAAAQQGSKNDWLYIFPNIEVPDSVREKMESDLQQIIAGYPIQYIEETVPFAGLEVMVNPSVLIPRPETEELASIITSQTLYPPARILDIGTGSGVLALALKKYWPQAEVLAWDISTEAISTAKLNAERNGQEVEFEVKDILDENLLSAPVMEDEFFDIIVSNPPYVLDSEKAEMSSNVLDYEPHSALFVRDENPNVFYTAIIDFAVKFLRPEGVLYFECNPLTISEVSEYAQKEKFQTRIITDMFGIQRFLVLNRVTSED